MKTTTHLHPSHQGFLVRSCVTLGVVITSLFYFGNTGRAAIIATDDFESYTAGSNLSGGSGGSGWSNNWTTSGSVTTVQTKTLIDPGGNVPGGLQAARMQGPAGDVTAMLRDFPAQGGTVYLSFLARPESVEDDDFVNFQLSHGATGNSTDSVGVGFRNTANNPIFARVGSSGSGSTVDSSTNATDNTDYLIVAKVSKDSSTNYNRVDLFINPASGVEPAPDATATSGVPNIDTLSRLSVRNFFPEADDSVFVDSLRVSSSFSEAVLGASPGPSFAGNPMQILSADADAYVQANQAGTNFGASTELQAKNDGTSNTRKTYVRFDVSGVTDEIVDVELRLTQPDPLSILGTNGGNLGYAFNVYGLNDADAGEGWGEGSITWNNAPGNDTGSGFDMASNATLLGNFSMVGYGVDGQTIGISSPAITDFLNQDTDGQVSFMVTRVTGQTTNNTVVHIFSSKEGGFGPELKLTLAAAVPEPSTLVLAVLGILSLGFVRRRKRSTEMKRFQTLTLTLTLVSFLSFGSVAQAALIAGDSFLIGPDPGAGEYVDNKALDGSPAGNDPQNPTVAGFTGAWNTGGTGLFRSVDQGLTAPGLAGEAGGAVIFQFGSEVGVRNVKRNLSSPPTIGTGDEFWMAGLVQLKAEDPDNDGFAYAGFASDLNNDNSTQGLKIGVEDVNGGGLDLVYRHRSGLVAAETVLLQDIVPGDTHLVVIRASVNSDIGGGGVPGNDNISIWIDPASSNLGAPNVLLEDFSLFNNNALQFLTFEGSNITGDGVLFDEMRLSSSLDGLNLAAPTPEPSTAMLLMLGTVLGIAARSRRRKRSTQVKSVQTLTLTVALVSLLSVGSVAQAATISFQEGVSPSAAYVADNTWIRSGSSANTPQDNDPDDEIIGGFSGTEMRPMFAFDLSAIETAAAGNPFTIDSVQLVLTSRGANQGTSLNLDLHEYGFAFVESSATWNDPDGDGNAGTGDTTAGGTLGTTLQSLAVDPSSIGIGDTLTFADSATFQSSVVSALSASDNTLRLLLKGDVTSNPATFVRIYDETFATTGSRPELVVDFTVTAPTPEPSTLVLAVLGMLSLGINRRRNRV